MSDSDFLEAGLESMTRYYLQSLASYEIRPGHSKKNEIRPGICVFKVPEKLRKLQEDAYDPRIVSIGPFHLDKGSLAPMRQHKLSYFKSFVRRNQIETGGYNRSKRSYDRKCSGSEDDYYYYQYEKLKKPRWQCYSEEVATKELYLSEILVIDGCFIMELLLRSASNLKYITPQEYESDPVINSTWIVRALWHDLTLLENQIPFFTLETIYDIIKPDLMSRCEGAPESVGSLALSFFKPLMCQSSKIEEHSYTDCKHLLDLLHKSTLLAASRVGTAFEGRVNLKHAVGGLAPGNQHWGFEYCASELVQSGVELCKESEDSLVNITFTRDGGLIQIPPVFIDDIRETIIRNLIAYEQSSIDTSQHVTSYVILMKTLIRSARDVKLLRKKGIISQNWIEDEEFVTQFKSLLEGVVPKDFYFGDLCKEVNAYASKFWFRRKMHSLYRTYFSTAWSMISFIAATCLFILTLIQTYFAVNPR